MWNYTTLPEEDKKNNLTKKNVNVNTEKTTERLMCIWGDW